MSFRPMRNGFKLLPLSEPVGLLRLANGAWNGMCMRPVWVACWEHIGDAIAQLRFALEDAFALEEAIGKGAARRS